MRSHAPFAVAALSLTLALVGCVSSSSVSEYEGPSVGDRTLAQIEPGETSQEWILAVLGEPTETAVVTGEEGDVEIWR